MTRELTNSMRSKFASCHRAYRIAYVDLVRPAVDSAALSFGTAMHRLLEGYWSAEQSAIPDVSMSNDPYVDATLHALFTGYVAKWGKSDSDRFRNEGSEIGFTAPLMNPETGAISKTWHLAGKIDAIATDKATGRTYIVEHKTTSSDIGQGSDYWRKIPIDGQVSGYFVGARANGYDADVCLYDVIRKPSIRPSDNIPLLDENGLKIVVYPESGERVYKKDGTPRQTAGEKMELIVRNETVEEWHNRLSADIAARPDYYYARLEVVRSDNDLAEYLFDMWAVGREIADAERLGRFSRNPNSCSVYGTCEYFDVCTGCASLDDVELFRKIDTQNPELKTNQKE